ncbi:MAG TPA: hypothetical protein VI197_19875 [Polyangiaceae bacterium]
MSPLQLRTASASTPVTRLHLRRSAPVWSLVLGLTLLSQCNEQEPAPAAETSARAAAKEAEPPAPSAEAAAPAPAESDAAAPSASAGGLGPCGEKGQPDCPLQGFMKREVKPALKRSEFEKLAAALEKVSKVPPQGYDEWAKIAMSGVDAAKKQDAAAAKEACESCHDKYEDKFKEEHRTEQLP